MSFGFLFHAGLGIFLFSSFAQAVTSVPVCAPSGFETEAAEELGQILDRLRAGAGTNTDESNLSSIAAPYLLEMASRWHYSRLVGISPEDLVQQVFHIYFRTKPELRPKSFGWFPKVLRNLFRTAFDHRYVLRRTHFAPEAWNLISGHTNSEGESDESLDPRALVSYLERLAENRVQSMRLRGALSRMPERQKRIVMLFSEGASAAAIGVEIGEPSRTEAKKRLANAIVLLQYWVDEPFSAIDVLDPFYQEMSIAGFTDKEQPTIRLRREGLDLKEIADRLSVSLGRIKSRSSAIRLRLELALKRYQDRESRARDAILQQAVYELGKDAHNLWSAMHPQVDWLHAAGSIGMRVDLAMQQFYRLKDKLEPIYTSTLLNRVVEVEGLPAWSKVAKDPKLFEVFRSMSEPARTLVEWSYFGVRISAAAEILGIEEGAAKQAFEWGARQLKP